MTLSLNFLYEAPDSNFLKLIDFGFSKIWKPNTKMALSCGTLAYVAPEVLAHSYTSQCDLWSFGVIVFVLLNGHMPFTGDEAHMISEIKSGEFKTRHGYSKLSEDARSFISSLLVVQPKLRLTAEQALEHSWIKNREHSSAGGAVDDSIVDALTNYGHASTFRRICMSMMAWSLTNEERTHVRNAFLEMDVNNTGKVSIGDFKRVLEEKFHIQDEDALRTFQAIDINHDDEIQYSEFLAAMVSRRINLHNDLLHATFSRFDTDNTGYIDAEHLRDLLGDSFSQTELEGIVAEASSLHNGKISYSDWISYVSEQGIDESHHEVAAGLIDKELKKPEHKRHRMLDLREIVHKTFSYTRDRDTPKQKTCCNVM